MREEERQLRMDLGERIRALREQAGWSREQLAERSGLDCRALTAFEEGEEAPAIGQLAQLAPALSVDMGSFFARGASARRVELVRAKERWDVEPKNAAARSLNYRYQALAYGLSDKTMSPFLVEIPPAPSSVASAEAPHSRHAGEEFLFVLNGQLEAEIAGERYLLGPGDSIYFDSSVDHTLRATEGAPVRLLACIAHAVASSVESTSQDLERAFGRSRG